MACYFVHCIGYSLGDSKCSYSTRPQPSRRFRQQSCRPVGHTAEEVEDIQSSIAVPSSCCRNFGKNSCTDRDKRTIANHPLQFGKFSTRYIKENCVGPLWGILHLELEILKPKRGAADKLKIQTRQPLNNCLMRPLKICLGKRHSAFSRRQVDFSFNARSPVWVHSVCGPPSVGCLEASKLDRLWRE